MQRDAPTLQSMPPKKKPRKKSPSNSDSVNITITEKMKSNGSREYLTHVVQGWKEDDKWQRKYFRDRAEAERFAADKRIELINADRARRSRLTTLTEDQIREAESAFDRLGDTYTLGEAIQYFMDNHRPPEFEIQLSDAIEEYLMNQAKTVRERTLVQKRSTLGRFVEHLGDKEVHKCRTSQVISFLRSLRAKDGVTPASRKTWNNYRNDLNHFFKWASEKDLETSRPWIFSNPAEEIKTYNSKQIDEQRDSISTTDVEVVEQLFAYLVEECPQLINYYALAYFAGIRPGGELHALHELAEDENLINFRTKTILIPPKVSKTKEERRVNITDNLVSWLEAYNNYPIIPKNFDRLNKQVRKKFDLQHDETRHSFISYHVAVYRSAGDAALQAGNSESIVKRHYLEHRSEEEGLGFFAIKPRQQAIQKTISPNFKVI